MSLNLDTNIFRAHPTIILDLHCVFYGKEYNPAYFLAQENFSA